MKKSYKVNYQVKKSLKAKHIRLTVHADGRVVLTVPKNGTIENAKIFLAKKRKWILEKTYFFKTRKVPRKTKPTRTEYLHNKNEALNRVKNKILQINQYYGFMIGKITIRNQSTRWGSCSKKGNLNFNFKVKYLPEELLDYLVTHELCHLQEFNHSKKFWDLVKKRVPNYKLLRKKLNNWSKTETLL